MSSEMRKPKVRGRRAEWTLTDAKARLSRVVQQALDGEPQRIVRNGHDVVVVVAATTYDAAVRPKRSLVELFSALGGSEIEIDRPREDAREVPMF